MANEEIASQVLDYWFAIEFLGQDSYDVCTEESKLVRALKTFKKADQSTKNKRRQISVFELVNSESDIYSQIVNQAKECDMTIWGNLTFYIGRVSRQACIEKLAQELGAKLEQEERNSEYIPILSFQCTTNGAYVEHSLSLSTVIWAISQVEGNCLSGTGLSGLAIMEAGVEYSTEQVAEKIGLKGPRTRQLLNELVNKELLACIGTTKRRRYIKPVD